MTPKLRITLNKGRPGVLLDKLAGIAQDVCKFLESLGEDLRSDGAKWVAHNFENGSLMYDLSNPEITDDKSDLWERGLRCVISGSLVDERMNLIIRRETRREFFSIARRVGRDDAIEFGIYRNGEISPDDIFRLDRSALAEFEEERPELYRYHGELQGVVHAFFKEAKRPKLSVRDLATQELVDCYFPKDMYLGVIELLRDEDAVIFVEGIVSEDANTGIITEVQASEFTPAPTLSISEFESLIGAFPNALTGGRDAAVLLDDFRDT